MKKMAVNKEIACKACLTCVNVCSEAFYKVANTSLSCIQVVEKNGDAKVNVCIQCGKCARACESEAITQNAKGVYMIDKKLCTNCGKCIEACPFNLVVKHPDKEVPSKCIACGKCVKACPMDMLFIKESE